MALRSRDKKSYVRILSSDGTFRLEVPEGTEGAVTREYELKDGTKGTKIELVFDEIEGVISSVKLQEGDFGPNIQLTIEDEGEDDLVLSVGANTPFGEDLMKKLPNVNLAERVILKPFSFKDEKAREKRGITLLQNGEKVKNYYWDETTGNSTNGFPEPKGDTSKYNSAKWKLYFQEVNIFLTEEIEKRFGTGETSKETKKDDLDELVDDFVSPENIPF